MPQPKRPTGSPYEQYRASSQLPKARAAPAQSFPRRTRKRRISYVRNGCCAPRSLPIASPGWKQQSGRRGIWGLPHTVRHGSAPTEAKSYQIRHRPTSGTQTVPRLPALARLAPFLPSSNPPPPGCLRGADRSDKIMSWDIQFPAVSHRQHDPGPRPTGRPTCAPAGDDLTLSGQSSILDLCAQSASPRLGIERASWLAGWPSPELSNHLRVFPGML